MWFPSGGLHIYVSALDSELFELELDKLHLHQNCFQLHHIRRESFVQQFAFQGTASFSQSHGGAILKHGRKVWQCYWEMNPSVEQIAIRSMTWSAHGMNGLRSPGFCGQLVILTETLMSFRGRSEVVLRSFGSREKRLNNDPWIHSNYTIWKSDPCLNSPERVGSSVFLVDMHFLGAPTINSKMALSRNIFFVQVHWWHTTGKSLGLVKTWF